MAIFKGNIDQRGFSSKLPAEFAHFNLRELSWLWVVIQHSCWECKKHWPPENSLTPAEKADYISQQISSSIHGQYVINHMLSTHQTMIVDQKYLDWINENDGRLLIWIIERANTAQIMNSTQIYSARRYDIFIKHLDLSTFNASVKAQFLVESKNEWGRMKSIDSEIKWIDPSNEEQIKWAWSYLFKSNQAVNIPTPIDRTEIYDGLLASIDRMSYWHRADKELFLTKMKKTWSQKKFRDSGKAKKPYHLPLTETTKKKLDELAKFYAEKPMVALERLITEAYSKEIQDDKGKPVYNSQER